MFEKRREKATNTVRDPFTDPTGVVEAAECSGNNGGEEQEVQIDEMEAVTNELVYSCIINLFII